MVNKITSSRSDPHTLPPRFTALAFLLAAALNTFAQGIPEPSLIFYGRVWNPAAGPTARLIAGTLTWTFQPTVGGTPVVASAQLSPLDDPFSFIMQVPCETQIGALTISSNVIQLAAQPSIYNRATVTLNGQPIYLKYPTQTLFSVTTTNRGRLERVDLTLLQSDQDSSGNGLPDGWQMQYFGHLNVDPAADPDHDGMSNLAEYRAGTDPTNSSSAFKFLRIQPNVQGGTRLDWLSAVNRMYILQRSSSPKGIFIDIASELAATPPVNSYLDSTSVSSGPFFYRLKLEESPPSIVDLDGNGLPDAWERQYFGQIGIDPNADDDNDGVSNLAEYLAGTDPTDPTSNFRIITAKAVLGGGMTLSWSSAVNKSYSILRSTNVLGAYETIASDIGATPPVNTYQDTPPPQAKAYFYRVTVP